MSPEEIAFRKKYNMPLEDAAPVVQTPPLQKQKTVADQLRKGVRNFMGVDRTQQYEERNK